VLATGEVETGRVGILDLQRHRWLRAATAFATVALIALLIVDFLQVVPHDQIMLSPTPQGQEYMTESRGDEPAEAIPEPAPAPGEEAPTEDVTSSDESGLGVTYGGEGEISGESAAGWPLGQI